MGSFAGVSVNAQELQEVVNLAEQKKVLADKSRFDLLNQTISDVKIAMPQYDSSNSISRLVQKPYLILQDFIVYVDQTDKKGNAIGQHQYPQQKNTVVFLPVGGIGNQVEMQNQYNVALKDGKLQELPIVSVESLVDKQSGFCGQLTPSQMMQTVVRPPCLRVSKGEILKGYIVSGTFTPYDASGFQNKKPILSFNEFKVFNSNDKSNTIENAIETKTRNDNKLKIMIIGAFVLGYLLSNK